MSTVDIDTTTHFWTKEDLDAARSIVDRFGIKDGLFKGPRTLNAVEAIAHELSRARGTTRETVGNSISFTLPSLPASLNELYELNRHDSGLPRKRLRAEWSLWVTKMIPYVPAFTMQPNSVLRIDRTYFLPWFYAKNGRWRKVDVVNMDALLFNLVTRKIGIDDLYVKQGFLDSRNSHENKVEVVVTEITEAQWRLE